MHNTRLSLSLSSERARQRTLKIGRHGSQKHSTAAVARYAVHRGLPGHVLERVKDVPNTTGSCVTVYCISEGAC